MARPLFKDRALVKRAYKVMMLASVRAKAKDIGDGNLSKGVALAVMGHATRDEYRVHCQAMLDGEP